ncbi:hypothetical protein DSO57_1027768 [Entomophthora muscae]|uniref:Uncharacterized protein n=1 Tax=Entomophthora muscae TaxID=34485 RepID=A0ACC2S442_9FUNG|nr:hypothetical protein DSO57_1027768 [Entomophthora muscae]
MVQSIYFTTLLACSGIVFGARQGSGLSQAGNTPSYSQKNQKPSSPTKISDRAGKSKEAGNQKKVTAAQAKLYSKSEIDKLLKQAGTLSTEVCQKLEESCQKMEPVYMKKEDITRDYCMPELANKCLVQSINASKLH